jgi:hypothetical protein
MESFCIRRRCLFSHVGILFHSDILLPESKQFVCNSENSFLVLESTLSGKLNDDILTTCRKVKFGVQIRSFNELIFSYLEKESKIALAEIDENIEDLKVKFTKVIQKYITLKYERHLTNLITIHLPIPSFDSESVFCSELVYRILKDLDIDVKKKNPKKVSPNTILSCIKLKDLFFIT